MIRKRSSSLSMVAVVVLAALGVVGGISRTTRCNGRHGRHPLEPDRGEHTRRLPAPAGGAPPALQINLGMVQGAVYDAVKRSRRSITGRISSRGVSPLAPRGRRLSPPRRTAFSLTSSRPCPRASRSRTGKPCWRQLATQYDASLAAIPDNSFKRQGIAAGNAAADAMIAAREGDGRFGPSQWVPNSNPGHWDPVAPNGTTVQDPTPWVGGVKPFLMQSSSQFRSAGP